MTLDPNRVEPVLPTAAMLLAPARFCPVCRAEQPASADHCAECYGADDPPPRVVSLVPGMTARDLDDLDGLWRS